MPAPDVTAPTLVVAGLSARAMAVSARRAGWRVVSLDLFGDADTRAASAWWAPVGDVATMRLDGPRLAAALARAAREPGVLGWVAGSGLEADAGLLDAGSPGLARLGTARVDIERLRDPRSFFATLQALGLPHPPTRFDRPVDPHGWLVKRSDGSGGWHIRPLDDAAYDPSDRAACVQRRCAGPSVSALVLGDGRAHRLVALNRLTLRPRGHRPFVYHGALGPWPAPGLQAAFDHALRRLVPAFGLRGLFSLDAVVVGGLPHLLEVNPRPSHTMVLHDDAWPGGLMRAHVEACGGRLPAAAPIAPAAGLRGVETVHVRRRLVVDARLADALASLPHVQDLPRPGTRCAPGDPLCSVVADGPDAATTRAQLLGRVAHVRALAAAAAQRTVAPAAGPGGDRSSRTLEPLP